MAAPRAKADKGRLDLQEIKKLVELIERSPISEFELVENDLKIRISKNGTVHGSPQVAPMTAPAPAVQHVASQPMAVTPAVVSPVAAEPQAKKLHELKSPMVGTFYRAPAPDAEPYVRVGDLVEPGKVICIVEAMKLMNEIECDVRGRISEIAVENAQPVEFGHILFRIDTSAA